MSTGVILLASNESKKEETKIGGRLHMVPDDHEDYIPAARKVAWEENC